MADKCGFKHCDEVAEQVQVVDGYIDGDVPVFGVENGMPKNKLNGMLIGLRLPLCHDHLLKVNGDIETED